MFSMHAFMEETSACPEDLKSVPEAADDDVTIPLDLTKVMYTNLGPRAKVRFEAQKLHSGASGIGHLTSWTLSPKL